jgi:Fe-S-cluster-containing dehydrogenase component
MTKRIKYGLLIDYEYCTGCYTCQVACAQEYQWPAGMGGIHVLETIQQLPSGNAYLAFIPVPTPLCTLCAHRTRNGLEPACVQHCMARCMKYGPLDELVKEMAQKAKTVLWSPL